MSSKLTVIIALFAFTLIGCGTTGQNVKKLNPAEFQAAMLKAETVQLIDVRTPEEFASGHLEGARNLDINSNDFEQQLSLLAKDKPVFLYCAAGTRSGNASKIAAKKGFKEIYDMEGGITSWQSGKLPIVK